MTIVCDARFDDLRTNMGSTGWVRVSHSVPRNRSMIESLPSTVREPGVGSVSGGVYGVSSPGGLVAWGQSLRWIRGGAHVRSGSPTKRSPSSASCPGSGTDGASSMRSLPDWVFGNAITSRMFV